MIITGGQEYIYMPSEGTYKSKPFVAKNEQGELIKNIKWSIMSDPQGVTINEEGVVAINHHFRVGDINGKDVIIGAVNLEDNTEAKASLHVREPQQLVAFEICCEASIIKDTTTSIGICNVKDQYGEAFIELNSLVIKWVTSDSRVLIKGDKITVEQEAQLRYAGVRAKIRGLKAEKRFIILEDEEDRVTEEDLVKMQDLPMVYDEGVNVDLNKAREVDCKKYIYINKEVSKLSQLEVDVKDFVQHRREALYQVTVLNQDGSICQQDLKADAQDKLQIALKHAQAVEVTPVLCLSFGGNNYSETKGYKSIAYNEKYDGKNDYGFYGIVAHTDTGVDLLDEEGSFVMVLPDGIYDFVITKGGLSRSTIKINAASVGSNVGNGGTGREGITPYVHRVYHIVISGGTARISMGEKDYILGALEIRRASDIIKRKTHIFIGGDSTASNYYPLEISEPNPGEFQTGWGQVFKQYVTDEMIVHNLAGGGTYAKSWYGMAFPGVIANGEPGDYFLIQEGINDRTYSNEGEMVEYLTYMIDACRAKAMIPVLITAIQCVKFWKNKNGQDVGEYEAPEGGSMAAFADKIRSLAKHKGVLFIDIGKLCSEWYAKVGRTYVTENYQIYNHTTKAATDTLHLSYMGAKKIAEFIATDMQRQKAEGSIDCKGCSFDGIQLNELTQYTIEHSNALGEKIQRAVTGVKSVYKKYA
jgi:lysophospholipase L1-like esterase